MSKDVLVRGLRKGYRKGSQAVDGVGLDIETGEILVLRGPNGAGETTTVKSSLAKDGETRLPGPCESGPGSRAGPRRPHRAS
jgi:ABC-type branched-subunit amino acid transport system ATPase component